MLQFPMKFKVSASSGEGMMTPFVGKAAMLPEIACAVPKEFQGPGGGYSPEDLFALSLVTCFIATFKVFAEKTQFKFETLEVEGELIIDKNNERKVPTFASIDVHVVLKGAEDKQKAEKLLQDAERYCLVSQAISSKKNYHIRVE